MATFAQLCARVDARMDHGQPVDLGTICRHLMLELETAMPDPLTSTDTVITFDTVDTTVDQLDQPSKRFDDLRAAAVDALAAIMSLVAIGREAEPGPRLKSEASQLVDVALDWGQTAFALLRAGSEEDAYLLAKAVRAIDGDIEPTAGDLKEAHRVIARIIDGARADVR